MAKNGLRCKYCGVKLRGTKKQMCNGCYALLERVRTDKEYVERANDDDIETMVLMHKAVRKVRNNDR